MDLAPSVRAFKKIAQYFFQILEDPFGCTLLNIFMNTLTSQFHSLLLDSVTHTGIELPDHQIYYLALLLAGRVRQPIDLPPGGFTLELAQLMSQPSASLLQQSADRLLFCLSVCPQRLTRSGVSFDYYQDLDATAYQLAADHTGQPLFAVMAQSVAAAVALVTHCVRGGGVELVKIA